MPSPDFFRPAETKRKDRRNKLIILCIILIIVGYIFFPRSLERLAGLKDISAEDIAAVHVTAAPQYWPVDDENFHQRTFVTDKEFIEYIVSLFDGRYARKLLSDDLNLKPPTDTTPRIWITLIWDNTVEPIEYTGIRLSYENRIYIDDKRYRLYGDPLDLHEIGRRIEALPESENNPA